MTTLNIRYVKTSELIPYVRNARVHSDEQVSQIAASIKEFGFCNPILISKGSDIIAGHGRLQAARLLKLKEVPVIELGHLTEIQKKAYILADNRLAEKATWDANMLSLELNDIKSLGYDVDLLAFDDSFFELPDDPLDKKGLIDEDSVPEVLNEPITASGELWILGNHRLLCGDSTKRENVERLMNGEKADMVFTDPPYGMNLDVEYDKMFHKNKNHKKTGSRFKRVEGDNRDYDPSHIFEMFTCEKFLWGCDYYYDKLPKGGCFIAWDKRDENLDKVPGNTTEFCWSDKPRRRMSFRIKWSGHHGMQNDDTKKRVHPTQKPTRLVEAFFEQWGKDKKNVVDIFIGSGSTLIACEKTSRRCFGMEIDPHYCDVIIERWQKFTGKQAVLDNSKETYDSRKLSKNVTKKVFENGNDRNSTN